MSFGEYCDWQKAKKVYEERINRALRSDNPLKALDRIREDLQEAFDLKDIRNREIKEFYDYVKQLMLEQEVA